MQILRLTDAQRDEFVGQVRLGVLTTLRPDGAPFALPLWFAWDGSAVEMFSARSAPKVKPLRHDTRASLLVANHPDESARWVLFEGSVAIDDSGLPAATRLFDRYHTNAPANQRAGTLKAFAAADIVRLLLVPTRIVSYAEIYD